MKVKVEKAICYKNKWYVTIDRCVKETYSGEILGFGTKEYAQEVAKEVRKLFKAGYDLGYCLRRF